MRSWGVVAGISGILLAACSAQAPLAEGSSGTENIACAIGNAPDFSDDCSIERIEQGDETLLIVRHENGGFRRFQVLEGQGGLVTADGADEATMMDEGTSVLVTVGADRYRIPVGGVEANEPSS